MGYAAVRGGLEAIQAAEELVRRKRVEGPSAPLELNTVVERLRLLVDRVMGEGSLYAPQLAARAVRQTEGDVIEAAQLLRSYRSTLPRLGYSQPVSSDRLRVLRRIVPAYRTPPGPQLLGRTLDYTGRLLDTADDDPPPDPPDAALTGELHPPAPEHLDRMLDVLRQQDLIVERRDRADPEPVDIVREPVTVPAPRSARLAILARGETGALVNLWYQSVRGEKAHVHEITLGELRYGTLPVEIVNPVTGNPVAVGEVAVTEVEAYEDVHDSSEDRARFDVGYGLCFGHNERKAIAMSILDVAIERDANATGLEQSVLQTVDGLDATGFLEHLKLPHYVTFRSMVERKLAIRRREAARHAGDADVRDLEFALLEGQR